MTDQLRQAAQQALEALEGLFGLPNQWESGGVAVWRLGGSDAPRQAITALRTALEQQAEPVNQVSCFCHDGVSLQSVSGGAASEGYLGKVTLLIDGEYVDYVKAQPEQQAEPVQEPVAKVTSSGPHAFPLLEWLSADHSFRCNIGDLLYTAPPQQQAEPVAWLYKKVDAGLFVSDQHLSDVEVWHDIEWSKPLYTTPPQRQWVGLTDEDCKRMSAGDKLVAMWADRTLKERNGY